MKSNLILKFKQNLYKNISKVIWSSIFNTVCLIIKKETGTDMPISLKFNTHLDNFGYFLLEGYFLFPTVPRNVGSIPSVIMKTSTLTRGWPFDFVVVCTKSFKFSIYQCYGTGWPKTKLCMEEKVDFSTKTQHNDLKFTPENDRVCLTSGVNSM